MKNQIIINLLKSLTEQFHAFLKEGQADGILKSISITLDKAFYLVSNNLPMTVEVQNGIEKSTQVAVKLFEGSSIEDDLFNLRELIIRYTPQ